MSSQVSYTEPLQIVQGQTISFTKQLWKYLASDGWSLKYSLRGGGETFSFTSTASADNHVLLVAASVTASWLPSKDYILQGEAINTDGTVEEFYRNAFEVQEDCGQPGDDLKTHAQRMLESIEGQLEILAKNILQDTTVEGTRILRAKRDELYSLRAKYFHERKGELAAAAARNGKPTGRKIKTVLAVMPPGSTGILQFGAGNSIYNSNWP